MTVLSLILQCILIFSFFFAGLSKITGSKMQVEAFNHLKLPQWFRVVTGLVTFVGVAGLITGFWKEGVLSLAGLWIACIMFGALLSHIRVKDPLNRMMGALLLLILALILALIHISALQELLS